MNKTLSPFVQVACSNLKKSPKLGHTKSTTESKSPLHQVVLPFNEYDAQEVNSLNFVITSKQIVEKCLKEPSIERMMVLSSSIGKQGGCEFQEFIECRNPNIGLATKCEVQGPMRFRCETHFHK
jgi:hypothetical protein